MNCNAPRVSIGLPVYNGEKYLDEALDSILGQTFGDFELIISDNGSTDRTEEICRSRAATDPRIRYYRNETNLGAAPNFNRTFELATGEYFKWAAHDDLLAAEFLEKCVDALDRNPSAILCYSKVEKIDANGAVQARYDPTPDTSSPQAHERFWSLIIRPWRCLQVFGLMRAETLRKTSRIGNYPSSDEVLLAELALYGRFHEIPEYLFQTRLHEQQSTKGHLEPPRARVTWFDTSRAGQLSLPKWRYLGESLQAIQRAPLSLYQRAYCCAAMCRWLVRPRHFIPLTTDLFLGAKHVLCSPRPDGSQDLSPRDRVHAGAR